MLKGRIRALLGPWSCRLPRSSVLCCGVLLLLLQSAWAVGASGDAARRVLFVGNSFTSFNKLPLLVESLAAGHGVAIEVYTQLEPDYSLADHLDDPRFDAVLKKDWDVVILQQGPSGLPESRRNLGNSVKQIVRALDGRSVQIALYSTWPRLEHIRMSREAEASYSAAAKTASGCVMPVAAAWRLARDADPALPLYHRDQMHPTLLGSQLAAVVIVQGLVDVGNVAVMPPASDATPDERARMQQIEAAARLALDAQPRTCRGLLSSRAAR